MTVQAVNYTPTAISDANGNATFTFQQTPLSQTATFTLNIPNAPDTTITTALINGNPVSSWQGSNTYGPLQLGNGQQLSLSCTGLSPNSNYQATAIGHVFTVEQPPITWPASYADSVTIGSQQILLENGSFDFLGGAPTTISLTIPASILYRSFTIYQWITNTVGLTDAISETSVLGNQSGYSVQPTILPYVVSSVYPAFTPATRFPLIDGTDTTYNVGVGCTPNGSGTLNYVVVGDLQNTDVAVYNADGTNLNVAGTVTVIPSGQQHVILDSPLPLPVSNTNSTELYVRNLATDQLYVKNLSTDQLYIQPATNGTMNGSVTSLGSYSIAGGLPIANNSFLFGGVYFPVTLLTAPVGGATKASVSVTTATATQIVAAPASNKVLRVHNLTIRGGTAGTLVRVYCNSSGYDLWYSPINGSVSLNGQLVTTADGAVYVAASGVTTACVITVTYDTYSTPQTS